MDWRHSCKTRVLPISNASAAAAAAAAFSDTWVYWISTTLQRGTAETAYGVTQGEKSMSAARMAKDQQMAEAVLRDKDPGWYQAQDRGCPRSIRTT